MLLLLMLMYKWRITGYNWWIGRVSMLLLGTKWYHLLLLVLERWIRERWVCVSKLVRELHEVLGRRIVGKREDDSWRGWRWNREGWRLKRNRRRRGLVCVMAIRAADFLERSIVWDGSVIKNWLPLTSLRAWIHALSLLNLPIMAFTLRNPESFSSHIEFTTVSSSHERL